MTAEPAAPPRRTLVRRLGRIGLRAGLVLLLVLFVARVTHALWLPSVAASVASGLGFDATYEDLDLSVFGARVELSRLRVAEAASGAVLATVDHVELDADVSALLVGALRVHRIEVDGVEVFVRREADGRWNLARIAEELAGSTAGSETDEPGASPDTSPDATDAERSASTTDEADADAAPAALARALDFSSPVEVDALVVQGVRVNVEDELVSPPLSTTLALEVRVLDVGREDPREHPARVHVFARAPSVLEAFSVDATAVTGPRTLEVEATVGVENVELGRLAPYLAPLGLVPVAERLALSTKLTIALRPEDGDELGTTGAITVYDTWLAADGETAAALDALTVDVARATTVGALLDEVRIRGARAAAARDASGAPRVAGLALVPPPATDEVADDAEAVREARSTAPSSPFSLELRRFALESVELRFVDGAIAPPTELRVVVRGALDDLVVPPRGAAATLAFDLGVDDAFDAALTGTVLPSADAPSCELVVRGTNATLAALAPYLREAGLEATLADGTFGVELDARADVAEDGVAATLELRGMHLSDAGVELVALDALRVSDVRATPDGELRIGSLELDGVRGAARLEEDGALALAGLRTVPGSSSSRGSTGEARDPSSTARESVAGTGAPSPSVGSNAVTRADEPEELPRIEVDRVAWTNTRLAFEAPYADPPVALALAPFDATLESLALGGDPSVHERRIARIEASGAVDGLARSFRATGTLATTPGALDLALELSASADGLAWTPLAGLLADAGLAPTLLDGAASGRIEATARQAGDELLATLRVAEVALREGDAELLALDELRIDGVSSGPERVAIERVAIVGPRIAARRDASGSTGLLGVATLVPSAADGAVDASGDATPDAPAKANETADAPGATAAADSSGSPTPIAAPGATGAAGASAHDAAPSDAALPDLALDHFTIEGARVAWRDALVDPPLAIALGVDVEASALSTRSQGAPMQCDVVLRVDDVLQRLSVNTTAVLDAANALTVDSKLELDGLAAGPLAAYVPDGLEVALADAVATGEARLSLAPLDEGGFTALVQVTGAAFGERASEGPYLALDDLTLRAKRIDPAARVFELERISTEGLRADVRHTERGLEALGIVVLAPANETAGEEAVEAGARPEGERDASEDASTAAGSDEVATEVAENGADASASDARATGVADAASASASAAVPSEVATGATGDDATSDVLLGDATDEEETDASAVTTAAEVPPPLVTLGLLDVGIARLRYVDEVNGGVPLDVSAHLVTDGEQVLLAPEPDTLAPLRIDVVGTAAPLVDGFESKLTLAPYAHAPTVDAAFRLFGVRGPQLAAALPSTAESIDASAMTSGNVTAHVALTLDVRRRHGLDFDWSRGFGAELAVTDVALRAEEDGEVQAGVESIDVDVERILPTTGDVRIRSIDWNGSRARITKEAEGLRIAGVLVRVPTQPEGEGDAAGSDEASAGAVDEPAARDTASDAAEVVATEAPRPELAIERFTFSGLDFEFVDTTVEPTFRLPIADLELEVEHLTTRALDEPVPMQFRMYVDAGLVELPERSGADHLLSGIVSSAVDLVGGEDDRFELEQRRAWDRLSVAGRLTLVPAVTGRVEVTLQGLELPAFAGPAGSAGVDIGDGLVDVEADLRLRGVDGIGVDARAVSSYLSLSEAADGPISQYLKLPAPLDTVLFLMRDDAGAHELAVNLVVPAEGASVSSVLGAVGLAVGKLVVDAVAAAPVRLLGPLASVADALGLTPVPVTAETVALDYRPGALSADDEALDELAQQFQALRGDPNLRIVAQHAFGPGDVEIAERLANPPRAAIDALVRRLSGRKADVSARRAALAAETRVQYTVGLVDEAEEGTRALRRLDGELTEIENALEDVLALTGPSAERRSAQRTRNAALAIARERMHRLRLELTRRAGPGIVERIEFRRPAWRPETIEGLAADTAGDGSKAPESAGGAESSSEPGAPGASTAPTTAASHVAQAPAARGGRVTLTPRGGR